ncbi:hypothetical protein BV898_05346 [Hypsibius exemplaris]|uniref:Uncharacterized protein n=1 Tax=Hypsibius exemplaris TaxID=2072580 RepID=A0A1W0WZY9_HYPEX|nr:hypothetical protein BV898_05346 [Hypsibius exemplaris]
MSGRQFTSKFYNRTFSLPSRNVSLNAIGTRMAPVYINQFDNHTRSFKTVLQLDSETKSLSTPMTQGSSIRWFGVTFPPSDKPNSDRRTNEQETVTAVIATVIVAVIILLLTSFSIWRTSQMKYHNQAWILDSEQLRWILLVSRSSGALTRTF